MKVYVITTGEYSDYRICAVTLDKEKAEKLKKRCDRFDYTEAQIEEYDTDDSDAIITDNVYSVYFDVSGCVDEVKKRDMTSYTMAMCKAKPKCDSVNRLFPFYVMADSAEEAIKIAAERRAKYLAEEMHL